MVNPTFLCNVARKPWVSGCSIMWCAINAREVVCAGCCSHGHGSRPIADTEAVANRGARAARAASAGARESIERERAILRLSRLADGPLLLTSRPWLDGSTTSYAAELGMVGVRERALAVGQAAWTDGAGRRSRHRKNCRKLRRNTHRKTGLTR